MSDRKTKENIIGKLEEWGEEPHSSHPARPWLFTHASLHGLPVPNPFFTPPISFSLYHDLKPCWHKVHWRTQERFWTSADRLVSPALSQIHGKATQTCRLGRAVTRTEGAGQVWGCAVHQQGAWRSLWRRWWVTRVHCDGGLQRLSLPGPAYSTALNF